MQEDVRRKRTKVLGRELEDNIPSSMAIWRNEPFPSFTQKQLCSYVQPKLPGRSSLWKENHDHKVPLINIERDQYSNVNYYHRKKCFDAYKAFGCLLPPSSVWRHLWMVLETTGNANEIHGWTSPVLSGFRIRRQTAISPSEKDFPPSALIKVLKFFKKTLLDQMASDSVSGDHSFAQLSCALHECWPRLLSLDLREKHAQTTETRLKWRRSCWPCAFVIV